MPVVKLRIIHVPCAAYHYQISTTSYHH